MSTAPATPKPSIPAWREFARAPLVPVALGAGVGIVVDRYGEPRFVGEVLVAGFALIAWVVARGRRSASAPWLWLAAAALAAGHHHLHRHRFDDNDIARFAGEKFVVGRVRGTLDEEPARFRPPKPSPLLTVQKTETTSTVLAITAVETAEGWQPASGRARLVVEGRLDDVHHGDLVEVVGRLSLPASPSNPGERDHRSHLLDQRITAELRSKRSADGVTRIEEGWRSSLFGWLAAMRGWGARAFQEALPHDEAGLAAALLLGESTALDRDEWDVYVRTGTVHVLAISGQHLVVLAGFVWLVLRAAGVRRRRGAWIVMAVMIGYALLTGARPSAVRAAVMVCSLCGAIVLRRPAMPANAFALAWLIVIGLNPADPFTPGCQLSFLSVFVLVWGAGRWFAPRELTPLETLIDSTRSPVEKLVRRTVRFIAYLYGVSLVLGVANAPLILAWQNIASPAGILLGPPLILLTSLALIAGFLLLFASIIGSWLAWPFAFVVHNALAACATLVHDVQSWPGMWVFAPGPSAWWLVGFHLLLIGVVLFDAKPRMKCAVGLFLWTVFGLLLSFERRTSDELRVTFLSVGHGGCAVIETPDGRVLLYDAGTSSGPDLVRRTVAPYLWSRGIARIDELFLSHADLDHFNGVSELLQRFPVGQVTLTPSFAEKPSPGVAETIAALDRHGIPRRVVVAGDRFTAGEVRIEVLHPPAIGPEGNENARSLVLLLTHGERTFLLTGDLEGAGMDEALKRPVPPIDVLLAPHHGAVNSNARREPNGHFSPGAMAAWAKPRFVVASQEPRETVHLRAAYSPGGATVWDTATAGAVTIRSRGTSLVAEAFRTGEVTVIRKPN